MRTFATCKRRVHRQTLTLKPFTQVTYYAHAELATVDLREDFKLLVAHLAIVSEQAARAVLAQDGVLKSDRQVIEPLGYVVVFLLLIIQRSTGLRE